MTQHVLYTSRPVSYGSNLDLHFRHGLIDEHLAWVARLTMTSRLSNTAMKFVNHGNINDEV